MILALLGIPFAAVSFLTFWTLPDLQRPDEDRLVWEDRWLGHNLKNQLVEWVRKNPQWFMKFFSFLIVIEGILLVL